MRLSMLALSLVALLAPSGIAAGDRSASAVGYVCSAEHGAAPVGSARRLVMVAGVGTGGFPIATARPEAQAWFDYGMRLAHAFYHEDAKLAFKRSRLIDPDCAMCAWGEAWADGPTINYDVRAADRKTAGVIVAQAAALSARESPKNRFLIGALKLRYAAGAGAAADVTFAKAMDALSRLYPDDDEIAVMTSDAWLMLEQQHDDPQGVTRSVSVLEPVLRRHPDNTAAIHFYIHATEVADHPASALPYADRLGALAPGASHLVHMASHTFFRAGRYEDAGVANAKAIAVDAAYLRIAHDSTPQGKIAYHHHNLRFGLAGATAAGDGPLALRLADHVRYAFPADVAREGGSQISAGSADIAYGRFAPDRALALPDPGAAAPYAAALRHYARGEALAARGDVAGVKAEASAIEAEKGAADATPVWFHTSAAAVVRIAALTLRGRAAMLQGDPGAAAKFYAAAATIQDADLSFKGAYDPPPWWYPERRSLAAALLAAGLPAKAVIEARRALTTWPHEPLTLQVLGQAERAARHGAVDRRDLAEAKWGWRGESVSLARM